VLHLTDQDTWKHATVKLNVLLTVKNSISVYWNQRDALFIQFIENQRPLHVSSITCSSSGGSAQTACTNGIWHIAVSLQPCHSQLTLYACSIPNAVCVEPPKDERVVLEICRGLWFSINWMKTASRWFQYTDATVIWLNKTENAKISYLYTQSHYILLRNNAF
jgi:hypothetical protein